MKKRLNKKGFVADVLLASAALFVVVLVVSLVALILFNFNQEVQNTTMPDAAKEAAIYSEETYPKILGYGFLAFFIGFMLYTLITSVLINNIHPIFWILGFVIVLVSTIISSILKMVFGALESVSLLAPYVGAIPGATWYFYGVEIINIVWMGILLTIIYFTWER